MLLELLARKGRIQPRDLERIHFVEPPSLPELRQRWSAALERAKEFVASRPASEAGHLYLHPETGKFFAPAGGEAAVLHAPSAGGILPRMAGESQPLMGDSGEALLDLRQFFGVV
jgi:hypothetical protein